MYIQKQQELERVSVSFFLFENPNFPLLVSDDVKGAQGGLSPYLKKLIDNKYTS